MILSEDLHSGQYKIKAYKPGAITINDTTYHNSLIIGLDKLNPQWSATSLQDVDENTLADVLKFNPDLILLGTGVQFKLPSPKQLKLVYQRKIGIEAMDTGAACRTFVALSAEGRHVVAALLIK